MDKVCELHKIAAKEEDLKWGIFRNGSVYISGTNYAPPHHLELESRFTEMLSALNEKEDLYDKAIHLFLVMARTQFYYDVNKRMGRFIMNEFIFALLFGRKNNSNHERGIISKADLVILFSSH